MVVKLSKIVLCGFALLGLSGFAAQATETVKVGMIMTLSGPMASLGENIDRGAQLYVKEHEHDLPPDVKLDIIRRDDTGPNPDAARRLAQELIVRDHVQFLAGLIFTPNAAAIAPLATQSKTPVVVMNASTSNLTRLSPYISARLLYAVADRLYAWRMGRPQRLQEGLYRRQRLCRRHRLGKGFRKGFCRRGA
jgi:hypothetical protein